MANKLTIFIFLILTIFLIGCKGEQSTKEVISEEVLEEQPAEEIKEEIIEKPSKTKSLSIGDRATDDKVKITVNGVRYATKIEENDNEYLTAEAPTGKQFVIVDITVENLIDSETRIVNAMESTIVDSEGYVYMLDLKSWVTVNNYFMGGEILPGMKQRGELVYLLPQDAKELKFTFKLEQFVGITKVFELS